MPCEEYFSVSIAEEIDLCFGMGWVFFFDGECAFCSRTVQWVSWADRHRRLVFEPLQGEFAESLGFSDYASPDGGTIVLMRESDRRAFVRSDALIELARILGGGWRFFVLARFIPQRMRDGAYDWIARNRFRLMGKSHACQVPK